MNTKDMINQIHLNDRAVRAITNDGLFRIVCIKSTQTAKTAQNNHKHPKAVAELHSKVLTAAALMAAFLKGEERVIIDIQSSGSINRLYAEALQIGEVRGFASYENDKELNLAEGLLRVSRILYDKSEPITGVVEFKNASLENNIEKYLEQSEQIPSFVRLDTSFDDSGNIEHCGGIIVQSLPGAADKDILKMEQTVRNIKSLTQLFKDEMRPDQVLKEVFGEEIEIVKSTRVDFFCRCNKAAFTSKLLTLGIDELKSMKEDGHNHLVCQFCSKEYILSDEDFDSIISEIQAKRN